MVVDIKWGVAVAERPRPNRHSVEVAEWMGLPGDLRGKSVLELFSGDNSVSLGNLVRQRGGEYVSVDNRTDNGQDHIQRDVEDVFKTEPRVFNYVVAFGPAVNEDSVVDERYLGEIIEKMMGLVKDGSGNFVAVGNFSLDTDSIIRERIAKKSEARNWFKQFNPTWRSQGGGQMGVIKYVRR